MAYTNNWAYQNSNTTYNQGNSYGISPPIEPMYPNYTVQYDPRVLFTQPLEVSIMRGIIDAIRNTVLANLETPELVMLNSLVDDLVRNYNDHKIPMPEWIESAKTNLRAALEARRDSEIILRSREEKRKDLEGKLEQLKQSV